MHLIKKVFKILLFSFLLLLVSVGYRLFRAHDGSTDKIVTNNAQAESPDGPSPSPGPSPDGPDGPSPGPSPDGDS